MYRLLVIVAGTPCGWAVLLFAAGRYHFATVTWAFVIWDVESIHAAWMQYIC